MDAQRAGIDVAGRRAENVRDKLKRLEDRGWLRRSATGKSKKTGSWWRKLPPGKIALIVLATLRHDQPIQVGTTSLGGGRGVR